MQSSFLCKQEIWRLFSKGEVANYSTRKSSYLELCSSGEVDDVQLNSLDFSWERNRLLERSQRTGEVEGPGDGIEAYR